MNDEKFASNLPSLIGSESILISQLRFCELLDVVSDAASRPAQIDRGIITGNTSRLLAMRRIVLTLLADPAQDPVHENLANLVAAMIEFSS